MYWTPSEASPEPRAVHTRLLAAALLGRPGRVEHPRAAFAVAWTPPARREQRRIRGEGHGSGPLPREPFLPALRLHRDSAGRAGSGPRFSTYPLRPVSLGAAYPPTPASREARILPSLSHAHWPDGAYRRRDLQERVLQFG